MSRNLKKETLTSVFPPPSIKPPILCSKLHVIIRSKFHFVTFSENIIELSENY